MLVCLFVFVADDCFGCFVVVVSVDSSAACCVPIPRSVLANVNHILQYPQSGASRSKKNPTQSPSRASANISSLTLSSAWSLAEKEADSPSKGDQDPSRRAAIIVQKTKKAGRPSVAA